MNVNAALCRPVLSTEVLGHKSLCWFYLLWGENKYPHMFQNNINALPIRGQVLPECSLIKTSGTVIDGKFSFSAHIKCVCSKTSRNTELINKLSYYIPKKPFACLYYSLT